MDQNERFQRAREVEFASRLSHREGMTDGVVRLSPRCKKAKERESLLSRRVWKTRAVILGVVIVQRLLADM